jgi:uncharacterized delta-60 repeat protein
MASSVKVSGFYRDTAPYVKVGGAWKVSKEAWTKVSGYWKRFFLSGGVNDSSFATDTSFSDSLWANISTETGLTPGPNSIVYDVAVQPDGKIILAGAFDRFNFVAVNYILRLNTNGTLDTAFTANIGTGSNNWIYSIAVQSDGKILLGGLFTTFNGATVNRIVRLNSDGTRDTAFTTNTGTGANSSILEVAIQSDGKILLSGTFTAFNGVTINRLVRLNSDGTRDTTFTTNTGTGLNASANIAIQSDGKIVLAGGFSTFNGTTANCLVRLNSDGTRDTAFTTNTGTAFSSGGAANSVAIQSDGKILIGGSFSAFNSVTANRILRLNSNGTRDTAFDTNVGSGFNFGVLKINIQSDGKILMGGGFFTFNGVTANRFIRLNSNGTADTEFLNNFGRGSDNNVQAIALQSDNKIILGGDFLNIDGAATRHIVRLEANGSVEAVPEFNNTVTNIAIQADDKVVVAGSFSKFNETVARGIARLNLEGSLDTSFTANIGSGILGDSSASISSLAIQSDGKIVFGGSFTSFNGVSLNNLFRLNSDGTRDTAFSTNIGTGPTGPVLSVAIQSDGKIILGGQFSSFNGTTVNRIVRLNANGTIDAAFTTNTGTGTSGEINSLAIQSDGKILVGGFFSTFNGTSVNNIIRLNSDGTTDTTFSTNIGTGANDGVLATALQSDGKIILVGFFTSFNSVLANRIVRLNSNGTRDTAFSTNNGNGFNNDVRSLAIQSNGQIVVGGQFAMFDIYTCPDLARINPDGTLDIGYPVNFLPNGASGGIGISTNSSDSNLYSLALQSDNKAIIVGVFTLFGGKKRNRIARIGSDSSG